MSPNHPATGDGPEAIAGRQQRRKRILKGLQGRELDQAIADQDLWDDLRAEADSPEGDRLVTPGAIRIIEEARARRRGPSLSLFFSTDDVLIIPGFLGSELVDVSGTGGLIWIDPLLALGATAKLDLLKLGPYEAGPLKDKEQPREADAAAGAAIRPNGAIPLLYGVLKFDLEVRRYTAQVFGIDWRRDLEESARGLAQLIRARADQRFRPLHLIAHSQGSLVARRALQLLGDDLARQLVNTLVLLGPATAGTFSAVKALTGNFTMLEMIRRLGVELPDGFEQVVRSWSGLYQLIPWRAESADRRAEAPGRSPEDGTTSPEMARPLNWVRGHYDLMQDGDFWPQGIDTIRLRNFLGWGKRVDSSFFNDRTSIILGDRPTVGGVKHEGGRIVDDPTYATTGDGTVPDALALVGGVTRVYKAAGAEHMMLPATYAVVAAVRDILGGRPPRVAEYEAAASEAAARSPFPLLVEPPPAAETPGRAELKKKVVVASAYSVESSRGGSVLAARMAGDVTPPAFRRLRVFSFDPLMATEIESLGTDQITLELPWEFADGDGLRPGPVGEYIEVVDCDPASGCVYSPIDLNHPHVLAQDGLPVSEGDPRFHQQMTYAVAMNTIRQFEVALGRRALWSPRIYRGADGKPEAPPPGMPFGQQAEREYVQRLRIYPHAMREANAYYHPDKKALLFGYFPAAGQEGDRNLPGGTVFACLSHDVIAHETTHALLDGMHRYFTEPSNPDVFAFHEAFADIVALFQHFSHKDVLQSELAKARGDLGHESKLGILAAQFGEATGHHGALRQYLGWKNPATNQWEPVAPDPSKYRTVAEPHARGALLVAALFRSFANIYENRVKDLRRIATGGTGRLPDGDLHPDLVGRMAQEASKAARHLLTMCIRALDYLPPIDVTFGEYLRALITADYDLVVDDDLHYRVAVLSAFREWGIYPDDVRSLSIDNLLWSEPSIGAHLDLREFLDDSAGGVDDIGWDMQGDRRRAFQRMKWHSMQFHAWLARKPWEQVESLGLCSDPDPGAKNRSIRFRDGRPVFEVHAFRPCRRIGPDGQQRTEFVVELVQKRKGYFDPDIQAKVDSGDIAYDDPGHPADFAFRGGSTLLIDPIEARIRYCIQKPTCDEDRLGRERKFRLGGLGDGTGAAYIDGDRPGNPFAFLHR